MLIEFNTFQKHPADSKLSTNTYLMSVAAVFQVARLPELTPSGRLVNTT